VKRLVGVPGDHIRLRNGIVILNGVAQDPPK
jgi:signal peptidase I